jgi:hypothetical protein
MGLFPWAYLQEAAMREKPQATHIPTLDPLPEVVDPPQMNTPVIELQDDRHAPTTGARAPGRGAKITPRLDDTDLRDFAKEDEDALVALEQIEKALRGQLPG